MSQEPNPDQEPVSSGSVEPWEIIPIGSEEDPQMKELRETELEKQRLERENGDPGRIEQLWRRTQELGRKIREALDARSKEE